MLLLCDATGIPDLFGGDDADESIALSVASIESKWKFPFSRRLTNMQEFLHTNGGRNMVEMMINYNSVPIHCSTFRKEWFWLKIFIIPLHPIGECVTKVHRTAYNVVIILPLFGDGVRRFEHHLRNNPGDQMLLELFDLLDCGSLRCRKQKTRIMIPRFKIDHNIYCSSLFRKLGVTSLFNSAYGGHQRNPDVPDIPAGKITELVHRATFGLDEDGITTKPRHLPVVYPTQTRRGSAVLRFDRPFIFMVYSEMLNLPLLMGRVANPQSETQGYMLDRA